MSYTPVVGGTGLSGWSYITRTRETQQAAMEKSPQMTRDLEAFSSRIGSVQTIDQLVGDRQLLKVALGAFGLESDLENRAYIKKVLESDPADRGSFANRLSDKRYIALAQTFGFAGDKGPQVPGSSLPNGLDEKLEGIRTPADLLSDRALTRDTLRAFGLEGEDNRQILERILSSDLSDPTSLVNRMGDARYIRMVEALDFPSRNTAAGGVNGFVAEFDGQFESLQTADDLLDNERLLGVALETFGLEGGDRDFLRDVLTSDTTDETSFANQLDDRRYAALAGAFNFGGPEVEVSKAESFVEAIKGKRGGVNSSFDLVYSGDVRRPALAFFGLEKDAFNLPFIERVLEADPSDPKSLVGLHPDKRYQAMSQAFGFGESAGPRSYPEGFAQTIADRYANRQFEIGVGESDPNMRLALSLERELTQLADRGGSDKAQWYTVMSTPPLRAVFETALQLPSNFGTVDLDRQLTEFQDRSRAMFGTDKVSDFAEPEKLEELRRRFLIFSGVESAQAVSNSGSAALAILSGGSNSLLSAF